MNNSEAKSFVEKLINEVWVPGNKDNVAKFYSNNVKGQVNATPINYSDIQNRVAFVNARQKNRRFNIEDVVASPDNKISLRFKYSYVGQDNKEKTTNNIAIYHLDSSNKTIQGIWLVSDESFNYKENA